MTGPRSKALPLALGALLLSACGQTPNLGVEEGFTCFDGVDNDGDGAADCGDSACAFFAQCLCGNGVLDDAEPCDDGNDDDTDDCLSRCVRNECGDGAVHARDEACDDGNGDDSDGCLGACVVARCGDGVLHDGVEQCDDGNGTLVDGCLDCVVAVCGDAVIRDGLEGCDDGNTNNNDACRNDCVLATCGDGLLDPGEVCDDGNDVNTDACRGCLPATCGDGFVRDGVEACDDGNDLDTDACIACQPATCGDGFVQADVEACDDANVAPGDGCSAACGRELVNGGFEAPTAFAGWTLSRDKLLADIVDPLQAGAMILADTSFKAGGFTTLYPDAITGLNQLGFCTMYFGPGVSVPPAEGQRSAIVTMQSGTLHRLHQDVTIPASATLTWSMRYVTRTEDTPFVAGEHRLVVRLLDPKTEAVRATLFETGPGVPEEIPLSNFEADVSAFAGETLRLDVTLEVDPMCFPVQLDGFAWK